MIDIIGLVMSAPDNIHVVDGTEYNIDIIPQVFHGEVGAISKISRREAREIALRAAYAIEMRGCTAAEALEDPLVTDGQPISEFSQNLVTYCDTHRDHLDDVIKNKIERWEFHRVAIIDRLILRQAAAEMLYFPDIPPKVSINEAIEIGKKYSTENSGRFINGVLDSIYADMGRVDKPPYFVGDQSSD